MVAIIDLDRLTAQLVEHMAAEGISEPLSAPVSVASVIADLCHLAGVPVPEVVCQALGHDWGWDRQPVEVAGSCVVCGALPF